ncbi:hypothetical protein [Clostridium uliginosum]|uniref:Uncharacterized protein n=1 Tax=Clostridium uliginosum TaxID=119641 RepID=A0A1I1S6J3_9CLOT|nr:hypothetical protein [Clostridium uliginosum]SFD42007.1 hypothetical protein SAMN05421842_1452 [Clostridium uliginosum]
MYIIKSLELFNPNDKFDINFENYKLNKDKPLIVHRGHYFLKLFIQLSNLNESDRFAILLDNRIIFTKMLEVRKDYWVEITTALDILKEANTLRFLNNSDDLLIVNTIKGGLYMADTADFSIIRIDNANNKSFDLVLSEPFTNAFTATIKILGTSTEYDCSLVSNSLFPTDPMKKTLLIGKVDSKGTHTLKEQALINLTVPSNQTYRITVFKNNLSNESAYIDYTLNSFNAISDPLKDVSATVIGDRILKVSFKYPVKNVFNIVDADSLEQPVPPSTNPVVTHFLSNFYALYYGRDTNDVVVSGSINWPGAFDTDRISFSQTLSSDGKTLILQDNILAVPLTENLSHILALNKGKYHLSPSDKSKVLTDYSPEKRIVPMMELSFNVGITAVPAIAINATAPVRNEVTVSFDKAVMKPLDATIATAKILFDSNGNSLKISKITRAENDFNTLIFTLDNSNVLPAGNINLGVGSNTAGVGDLIDACGYIVPFTTLSVNVGSVPPTLNDVEQDKNLIYTNNTVINLTFSTSMKDDATGTGANNPTNYKFVDKNANTQDIKSATFVDPDKKIVQIMFKNLLGAGSYRLIISANSITDSIGEKINYTNYYPVPIEDTTKPSVVEIIGLNRDILNTGAYITDKDNAIIIKYKTPMSVIGDSTDDKHAANQPLNYKFIESTAATTNNPLPTGTTAIPLKNNKWIRFVLPTLNSYPVFENTTTLNGNPNLNYDMYIGYTELDDVRYVCNTSGNIYPLCSLEKITATVPLIDLSKGKVEITSDNELKYTYTDKTTLAGNYYNNEFNNPLNKSDFIVAVSNATGTPDPASPLPVKEVALSDDGTTITFTFDDGTFNSGDKKAYIGGTVNNSILDIFGKGLTGTAFNGVVINSVPSTLVGVSLTDISRTATKFNIQGTDFAVGYPVEIALKFSNTIKNTASSDFLVTFNNAINSPILSANVLQVNGNNSDTVLLESYIPSVATDNLDNILLIRTVSDKTLLATKDINNNTISPFGYMSVSNLAIFNAAWNFTTPDNLDAANLKATFNKDLDFSKLPLLAVKNAGATGLTIGGAAGTNFVTTDGTDNILTPYISLVDANNNKLGTVTLKKVDINNSIFTNSQESKVNETLNLATAAVPLANEAKTAADATPNTATKTAANTAVASASATKTAATTAKTTMTPANVTALNTAATTSSTDAAALVTAANTYNTNIVAAQAAAINAQAAAQAAVTAANVVPYDGTAVLNAATAAQTAAATAVTAATTAGDTATSTAATAAKTAADSAVTAATTAQTTPSDANIGAAKTAIATLKTATDATVTSANTATNLAGTALTKAQAYKVAADATKASATAATTASKDSDIKFNINIKKETTDSVLSLTFNKITADLTLSTTNLAYIEYTGEAYQFMNFEDQLYANTSLDYNANTTLK